jgi:DNA-3-methyladenine glycosylase I
MVTTHDHHRCAWCGTDPLYVRYHDEEWGVPLHDDRRLFEAIVLDGAQAGLSWITILRKRENYRTAFHDFDIERVARITPARIEKLMLDPGIVRNRMKIESAVKNARATLRIQEEFGSLSAWYWRFVDGVPIINHPRTLADIPSKTPLSDRISKDLKQRGFNFVGSTIIYAMMQATGMVDDHVVSCWRKRGER